MRETKQILRRIVIPIVAIICAVVFIPWVMVRAWLAPLPDTIQKQVNDALDYNLDGIIVYVDQSGKPPAFYVAGWKDRENKVPADPQALFKIGSISKLYIAAATSKLINSQRLLLDDTLAKLLPELAGRIENADKITLRMLLQHRSGIPDWIKAAEFPWDKPPTDVSKVLELVFDEPSKFMPDSHYEYSNTNYLLIGKILDSTLGYNHQQYIKKEILTPLGLTHTFGSLSEVNSGDVANGYDSHYDKDVKMLDFVAPGGSMVATAQDMGIFLRALNDGSLLNKEEQAIYSSVYKYEHTGLLPGYGSIARYHKDIDTVVIQFVNTSGGNAWTISEIIYNRIIRILDRQKRS
ncbi:serine hydrolase domain-containing protein [Agriterribacter sp.]|uniref:serine hydrolase domain-containing protein n=1 Tax=Agriterribacter sp. TaxID=2821509 RepID=UPI002D1468DD|nr:serine hydrolase domain-containing protein [Agriterribacter sp.]HRO45777.1 serine hydrolase domain-containing protein [Agriterribacter sp.]HRQ16768.1 serine hydrolase domain-containing protein [Agriterribacter sp.]